MRKSLTLSALALALAAIVWATAPNFGSAVYADGKVWGTKGLSELPPPNDANDQSFDKLFMFVNGAPGQLAVSEASPRNKNYNGGRWSAQTAPWTEAGLTFYNQSPPVLMSYDEIMMQAHLGYLATAPSPFRAAWRNTIKATAAPLSLFRFPAPMDTRSKIITRPPPAELALRFTAGTGAIVAIRGRFELLRASIVRQIEQSRPAAGGTVLAVVASDGPSNPSLLTERDRAQLAAALGAVDHVVICDEAETDALIAALGSAREIRLDESACRELIADVLRRNPSG